MPGAYYAANGAIYRSGWIRLETKRMNEEDIHESKTEDAWKDGVK